MEPAMAAHPSFTPALCYVDPKPMLDWLRDAFGFELDLLIEDEAGKLAHSQMSFGNGLVMIGNEWSADHKSPKSIGMKCTQTVHIHVEEDIDAHCERARRAGAEIIQEPDTQFYGDRTYRARDPEGHIWTFGQTVKEVAPDEWDKGMGLKTWARKK
jgi:uncharacterized glyoxalase superfamily protein PhnB